LSLPATRSTQFIRHKVEAIQFKVRASSTTNNSTGRF
jgi:hypothetical protein